MTTPRISLIIPAKDAAVYLGTMFESLHLQELDFKDAEVIFVNDGSTDDTPQVLERYGQDFPNFKVITNRSAVGLANGRNQGIDAASGEYIAFLDGDDWLAAGHLATMLYWAEKLDVDFIRCDHTTVQGTKRQLRRAPMSLRHRALNPRAGILPIYESTMVDYPFAWAGIFHCRTVDKGLLHFPKDFMTAEDRSWIWNLHLNADSFAVVDAPGILYRRGMAGSLSQVIDRRQLMFTDAFAEIFRLIRNSDGAAPYWTKAARNWLAILEHQVNRFQAAPAQLRKELKTQANAVSRLVPKEVIVDELARAKKQRVATVLPYLGDSASLVKELLA